LNNIRFRISGEAKNVGINDMCRLDRCLQALITSLAAAVRGKITFGIVTRTLLYRIVIRTVAFPEIGVVREFAFLFCGSLTFLM
jgi:hypothetical protein